MVKNLDNISKEIIADIATEIFGLSALVTNDFRGDQCRAIAAALHEADVGSWLGDGRMAPI